MLDDFALNYPSYEALAAFAASPIFDGNKKIGVLIFQFPIDAINTVMTSGGQWANQGLGKTGETYLFGKNNLLRSNMRGLIENKTSFLNKLKESGVENTDAMDVADTTILYK